LLCEANDLVCHFTGESMIDTHSPLVVLCSSLLLCWLVGSGQGPEVYWSGLVLGFCGLPTSYWLIRSERNPATTFARSLWVFASWNFEQHRPLSLNGLYLFQTGRHGVKTILKLEINNIWESPSQANLGERVLKIRNADNVRYYFSTIDLQHVNMLTEIESHPCSQVPHCSVVKPFRCHAGRA